MADLGQNKGRRDQQHKLPDEGHDEGVYGLAQRLKAAAQSDASPGQTEAQGDDPQSRDSHGHHGVRGLEYLQQRAGYDLEDGHTQNHHAGGVQGAALDGLDHAAALLGAVVVSNDGYDAVIQAEHRHKDEAVELEVDAEGGGGGFPGGVVGDEDLVHEEGHHRADGHHHHRRQADGINAADDAPIGLEAPEHQMDLRIFLQIQHQCKDAGADLAGDGGNGGARHTQIKQKNEDGVQNEVDEGAGALGIHGQNAVARALEQPFQHHLAEKSYRAAHDDVQVLVTHLHDLLHIRLAAEKEIRQTQAQHGTQQEAHEGQKQTVHRHGVRPLLLLGAQSTAHEGVDAHGGAGGQGDHQVLGRERQRYGCQ